MALLVPSTSALPVPETAQLSLRVFWPPLKPASTTCMPSLHLTEICFSEPLVTTYGVSASAVSEILPPETATVFSLVLPWSVSWYTLTEARFCQSFGRVHSVVPPWVFQWYSFSSEDLTSLPVFTSHSHGSR